MKISSVPDYKVFLHLVQYSGDFLLLLGKVGLQILHNIIEINTDWRHFYLLLSFELKIFRFLNAIENLEAFLAALV